MNVRAPRSVPLTYDLMIKPIYHLPAFLLCVLIAASGCSQIQPLLKQTGDSLEDQAAARAAQQDYTSAAQLYRLAGESAQEPRRSNLLLKAADAAMQANNESLTQQLLDTIDPKNLDKRGQYFFELLRVQALIANKPPEEGLKLLAPPASGTPPEFAARIWALRADLLYRNGQVIAATHALVQRDVWLLEPSESRTNDNNIWRQLREQPPAEDAQADAGDNIIRGWVTLARIGARVWSDRGALERELSRWNRRYPGHPATRHILPERFDFKADTTSKQRIIGIALPLSGPYANAAQAIQNGFLAGYYASESATGASAAEETKALPELRIYDSNVLSDANRLMEQAKTDQIDLMVGPLQKKLASELSQRPDFGIPVLALNYTDTSTNVAEFYQFGLAPEDEARAAAKRALAMGMRTAIVLVPQGDWGNRVLTAFRDAFSIDGGELIDYASFDPKAKDHARPIKRLLRYGQPAPPPDAEALETANTNGESSRRRNVDFIFVAAQPEQARQIRQQLRFYYASKLPILATSHLYTGVVNRSRDGDLEGILFADMPWLISTSPDIQARRNSADKLWPAIDKRYPRLFAMGYDAWLLAAELGAGNFRPGRLLHGNTGDLYLQDDGRVQRDLQWAQFKRGTPRAIPQIESIPQTQPQAVNY